MLRRSLSSLSTFFSWGLRIFFGMRLDIARVLLPKIRCERRLSQVNRTATGTSFQGPGNQNSCCAGAGVGKPPRAEVTADDFRHLPASPRARNVHTHGAEQKKARLMTLN